MELGEETIIPLTEAPEYLPRRRGKKIHISTLFRWAQKGTGGKQLETIKVGGTRCTSLEALQRFIEDDSGLNGPSKFTAQRNKSRIARTDKILSEADLEEPRQSA